MTDGPLPNVTPALADRFMPDAALLPLLPAADRLGYLGPYDDEEPDCAQCAGPCLRRPTHFSAAVFPRSTLGDMADAPAPDGRLER